MGILFPYDLSHSELNWIAALIPERRRITHIILGIFYINVSAGKGGDEQEVNELEPYNVSTYDHD